MLHPQIPDEEFLMRRETVKQKAKESGFDALLIWSRGGSSVETYGDLYYLTNFVSLFPCVPDRSSWGSRGHGALILPVDGDPILVTDYVDDPEDRIKVDDVRCMTDITAGTADILKAMGLADKRIGLVGMMSFLVSALRRMEARNGGTKFNFVPADDILDEVCLIKSPAEIAHVRHAAEVGVQWMNATMAAVAEGNTEGDVIGAGFQALAANGGTQQDVAISSGPNSIHYMGSSGIPHWNVTRKLQTGDLVHCDQWGPVNGYYTDFARSTVVGRKPDDEQRELLEGAVWMIHHIIGGIVPGKTTFGDLHRRGSKWLDDNGFSNSSNAEGEVDAFSNLFPFFGHAIGLDIGGPWIMDNDDTVIQANMALAVETLIARPGVGAVNFEENVVVNANGVEILTSGCPAIQWD